MKKALTIIGIGTMVLGAACAVGKVIYDKIKNTDPEDDPQLGSLGLPDGAVNDSKAGLMKAQLSGVGSDSAENNDYPRITVDNSNMPQGRRDIDTKD